MKDENKKYPVITEKDLPYINSALKRGDEVYIKGKDENSTIITALSLTSKRRVAKS